MDKKIKKQPKRLRKRWQVRIMMTLEKREKLKALIKMVNQKGETIHTCELFFFKKIILIFFLSGTGWLSY